MPARVATKPRTRTTLKGPQGIVKPRRARAPKKARTVYQPAGDRLKLPIAPAATHRQRKVSQKALKTSGDTHQSEHPYGYAVLAQWLGRPTTGVLGKIENDAPAYQESLHFHREH